MEGLLAQKDIHTVTWVTSKDVPYWRFADSAHFQMARGLIAKSVAVLAVVSPKVL